MLVMDSQFGTIPAPEQALEPTSGIIAQHIKCALNQFDRQRSTGGLCWNGTAELKCRICRVWEQASAPSPLFVPDMSLRVPAETKKVCFTCKHWTNVWPKTKPP